MTSVTVKSPTVPASNPTWHECYWRSCELVGGGQCGILIGLHYWQYIVLYLRGGSCQSCDFQPRPYHVEGVNHTVGDLIVTAGYTDLYFQEKLTLIPQEPTKIPQEPPKTDSCGSGAIVSRGRCATTNLTVVRCRTVSYIPKIDFSSTQCHVD